MRNRKIHLVTTIDSFISELLDPGSLGIFLKIRNPLKLSRTKLHSDVVSSHSWSANICGRKQWFMMPPGSENLFRSSVTESGFVDDIREYERLFEQAKVIKFVQEPGEIVFVPSNWYHQAHNLVYQLFISQFRRTSFNSRKTQFPSIITG